MRENVKVLWITNHDKIDTKKNLTIKRLKEKCGEKLVIACRYFDVECDRALYTCASVVFIRMYVVLWSAMWY